MKNKLKLLGIIALAAVIAFGFFACGDGAGGDGAGGDGPCTICGGDPCTCPTNPPTGSGMAWTEVASPLTNSTWVVIRTIAYGNNRFVIGGGRSDGSDGEVAYSDDGINWTKAAIGERNRIEHIAYGNGKFVAAGIYRQMMYSDDGINWVDVENPPVFEISSIAYGGNKFVAVGSINTYPDKPMAYSEDGINWTPVTDSVSNYSSSYRMTYGGNKFVAVDTIGDEIAYSEDGINWTVETDTIFDSGSRSISRIVYGGNKFVIVGFRWENSKTFGEIAYSEDGINWTMVTDGILSTEIRAIAYGGNKFIVTGYRVEEESGESIPLMAYSEDGINWTELAQEGFFSCSSINGIVYGGSKFVGIASEVMAYLPDWD